LGSGIAFVIGEIMSYRITSQQVRACAEWNTALAGWFPRLADQMDFDAALLAERDKTIMELKQRVKALEDDVMCVRSIPAFKRYIEASLLADRLQASVAELEQALGTFSRVLAEMEVLKAHTHGFAHPECPKCARLNQLRDLLQDQS
jgi:hypothetical protein